MPRRTLVPFSLPLLLLAACGGGDAPARSAAPTAKPAATQPTGEHEAKQLFDSLCATCHGTSGHGDGPGAAALEPKPRSFSDPSWQDATSDEQIKKTIVFGGAAVGKSAMMPAQPQLKGKDGVLDALVKIVRGYRAK
ncbi:MAG: c-type cytochrome [Planctomycetes bacterium]|nr:c-type cytochrome [Planctomycetota bacterium]